MEMYESCLKREWHFGSLGFKVCFCFMPMHVFQVIDGANRSGQSELCSQHSGWYVLCQV